MPTYVVSRTRAWRSEEELAATAECAPAIAELFKDNVRWIRSYVMREEDGSFSAHCVYEATGPEWLERHSEAAMLPADSINAVTVVAA